MLRLILFLILAVLLLFFSLIALAGYYLPWWGTVLFIVGLLAFVRYLLPRLIGVGISRLIVGFLNKFVGQLGAALKDARAQVHGVAVVDAVAEHRWIQQPRRSLDPEEDSDDDDANAQTRAPLRFVAIDLTVTPAAGTREGWHPEHLALVSQAQAKKATRGIMGLAGAMTHNPVLTERLTAHGDVMPEIVTPGSGRSVVSSVIDADAQPVEVADPMDEHDRTGPTSLVARVVAHDGDETNEDDPEYEQGEEDLDTQIHGEHRIRLTFAFPPGMPTDVRLIYFTHPIADLSLPAE